MAAGRGRSLTQPLAFPTRQQSWHFVLSLSCGPSYCSSIFSARPSWAWHPGSLCPPSHPSHPAASLFGSSFPMFQEGPLLWWRLSLQPQPWVCPSFPPKATLPDCPPAFEPFSWSLPFLPRMVSPHLPHYIPFQSVLHVAPTLRRA